MLARALVVFSLVIISIPAFSQAQLGRISGKVVDKDSNTGLASVTVYLFSGDTQKQSARTNAGGNFSFVNVEPGSFVVKTAKSGYDDFNKLVRVNANFTTKLMIPLAAVGSTSTEVVASAPITESKPVETKASVQIEKPIEKPKTDLPKQSVASQPTTSSPAVVAQAEPVQNTIQEAETVQEALSNDEPVFVEAPQESPIPVGGWGALGKAIKYPEIARKQKVEGTVKLAVYIDYHGDVISIEFIKKVHPAIDQAAEDAVYATKFKPGTYDGKPINTKMAIPIPFKL